MNVRDKEIIKKIVRYCEEIDATHKYFNNDYRVFTDKENGFVYRNSITMPILQIGELSKSLSDETRKEIKGIPWKEVIGIREIFAHHYGSIDYDIVWNTSKDDIRSLKEIIEKYLDISNME